MDHKLSVTVQIGKFGVTQTQIDEVIKQLKTRKAIKIKILKSALDSSSRKELFAKIVDSTNSKLVSTVGSVAVLKRKD